jgi:predicted nucleotidyltransferase
MADIPQSLQGNKCEMEKARSLSGKSKEDKILFELKDTVTVIAGENIIKLVLYGSRARGDYERGSDLDVAIIVRGLTRELKKRILDAVADMELKYFKPLSTLILSEEEFEFLKKRERRIALNIEREGITL